MTPTPEDRVATLSPRELDVARLAARGFSARYIARRYGISDRTVETHIRHVYEKLSLSNRDAFIEDYAELLLDLERKADDARAAAMRDRAIVARVEQIRREVDALADFLAPATGDAAPEVFRHVLPVPAPPVPATRPAAALPDPFLHLRNDGMIHWRCGRCDRERALGYHDGQIPEHHSSCHRARA